MIDSDSSITKHLPECHRVNDPESIHEWCLCDELRACEQRVTGELLIANTPPVTDQQWIDDARQGGYEDALADAIAWMESAAKRVGWVSDE